MTVPQAESAIAFVEKVLADLTSVFHRVNNILPEEQEALCIPMHMPVAEALTLMEQNNFSQIPITAGKIVLGTFSYRSFAQKISAFTGEKLDLNQMQVREFVEQVEFIDVMDDLVKALDSLDKRDAILVGNKTNLTGLLTSMDIVKYLYILSSPFVLLGEIEKGIRNVIRDTCTPQQLHEIMLQTLSQIYRAENMPKSLEEMTFNDYVQIMGYGGTWEHFEAIFGEGDLHRKRTRAKLKEIGELRNDAFHFKRELSENDINTLEPIRITGIVRA